MRLMIPTIALCIAVSACGVLPDADTPSEKYLNAIETAGMAVGFADAQVVACAEKAPSDPCYERLPTIRAAYGVAKATLQEAESLRREQGYFVATDHLTTAADNLDETTGRE